VKCEDITSVFFLFSSKVNP